MPDYEVELQSEPPAMKRLRWWYLAAELGKTLREENHENSDD